jgi:hypothetical protein
VRVIRSRDPAQAVFNRTDETMRLLKSTLLSLCAAVVFVPIYLHAATVTIDIVSETGASPGRVVFNGTGSVGTPFSFVDATDGFDFVIAGSSDAALVGLKGNISGTFTIGAISSSGPAQLAPVGGTGVFSIFDGASTLTADLSLIDIGTLGTSLGLNLSGSPNLTNFAYSGSVDSLAALATSSDAAVVLSAQFKPKKSLLDLTATGAVNASVYSATLAATPVPEPSSYWLLGAGLFAAAVSIRRRRLH